MLLVLVLGHAGCLLHTCVCVCVCVRMCVLPWGHWRVLGVEVASAHNPLLTAHPRFTQHLHIRLYYVGEVGGEVTFLKFVPLGAMSGLYTFTWLNSSGQAQQGSRHSLNANASLSIRGLQHSDGGRYGLRVTVNDSTGTHTFTNSSYQLFVQGQYQCGCGGQWLSSLHRKTNHSHFK